MRTSNADRAAFLVTTAALVTVGCGDTRSDKAGGAHQSTSTVLTMANGNGGAGELELFAAAAARLSDGTLRIVFKNNWRGGTPGYETGAIGDVKAGRADLAWAGTRAFDSVGVPSFDALHAPLLIDSYALQRTALESSLVDEMLRGLQPLDVVGLGILPGPLRKPLASSRLVRPADYAGKTLAFQRSQIAGEALRALGARGVEIPSAGSIAPYDGIEQQVASIDNNRYDSGAKYLTANVNLWPRPIVVFMNPRTFGKLSSAQRSALRGAARATLRATLASQQADEKAAAANLCRRGVKFVMASAADLDALRRALQPVYNQLERQTLTKSAIEQIRAMRSAATLAPDAPACSDPASSQSASGRATPIDGVYRMRTTAKELLAAGSADAAPENYGTFELTLDRGRFTQKQPLGYTAAGTYTVAGDTITLTTASGAGGPWPSRAGERFAFRWSLYRGRLTFAPVKGKISPVNFRVKPWRRLGNAPPPPDPRPSIAGEITALDGVYRVRTTAADLRATDPADELLPENYGGFEMVLDRGRFTQAQPLGNTAAGTYTVAGDTVTLTFARGGGTEARNRPGEVFDYRWSLYRDQLSLESMEGKVSPAPLRAKPWRRIGNAS